MMKAHLTIFDQWGDSVEIPSMLDICYGCNGRGETPFGAHIAITGDEFSKWDQDECHDYFSGAYDKPCPDCSGSGRVSVIDESNCTHDQIKDYWQYIEDENAYWAEVEAERRMGA